MGNQQKPNFKKPLIGAFVASYLMIVVYHGAKFMGVNFGGDKGLQKASEQADFLYEQYKKQGSKGIDESSIRNHT